MSEGMGEVVEEFTSKYVYELSFRREFHRCRATIIAIAIRKAGAPLQKCVGFIH